MDPGGMMNEAGNYNIPEIWPFPINGAATGHSSLRSGVSFAGTNLLHHQLAHSNLISTSVDPARMSNALSQAVVAGAKKRRDSAENSGIDSNDDDSKKQKIQGCVDEVRDGKAAEAGTVDQKKQLPEPPKDYIHVRARRGQATDSHSLAERARREKISERMKILQDLVPGCNKVIGKALVLDEIINYIQSLQRQVEFLSMKLEAVNSKMTPGIEVFPPKEFNQQLFENPGMQFGSQPLREYSRGASPEWLHMQVGSGLERT